MQKFLGKIVAWLLIAGLFGTDLAYGQREDTVFDVLLTQVQTVAPFQTRTVRNIGQSSHLFVVLLEDVSPGSCASPQNVDMGMEYSYGNGVWIRGGQDITRVTANSDGIITVNQNIAGAFPQVRFAVRDYDAVNCQLTVSYSGAVAAFNVNNVATNNNFLGLSAISTLSNPGNLNIQLTPNVPTIQNVNITNQLTFYRSLYDIWDASPWIVNNTVEATFNPPGTDTCTCASGCQVGTGFRFTDLPGALEWTSAATGTGYSAGSYQCNVDRAALAAAITLHDPYVNASFNAGNWTITFKPNTPFAGTGFRGNSAGVWCKSAGASTNQVFNLGGCTNGSLGLNRRFAGGRSLFRTQTTPQTLNGCVELQDQVGDTIGNTFRIVPKGLNCVGTGAEFILGRTDRGVQVQLYVDDYQAFSYTPTNGSLLANSGTVWGTGVPWIPPFVSGVTEFQWMFVDNKENTSNFATNWRNTVQPTNTVVSLKYGGMVMFNGVTYSQSGVKLFIVSPTDSEWVNSSGAPLLDAVLNFNEGGPAGVNRLVGQLWNAVWYQVNQPADTIFVFQGLNWHTWTNSSSTGSLMLRWN